MVVQSNRRDTAAALEAGRKMVSLNKYDMLALGEYGGRLLMSGDIEQGMAMLREAGAGGAVRPSWHYVYLFIGSYMTGQMTEAIGYANAIPNDNTALGQVAQVLARGCRGQAATTPGRPPTGSAPSGAGLGQEPAPGALPDRSPTRAIVDAAGQGTCQRACRRVLTGFHPRARFWQIIVFAGLFSLDSAA